MSRVNFWVRCASGNVFSSSRNLINIIKWQKTIESFCRRASDEGGSGGRDGGRGVGAVDGHPRQGPHCWEKCSTIVHIYIVSYLYAREAKQEMVLSNIFILDIRLGCIDKWVISKTTNLTTPELFIGLIQAIWRKNEHICLKKTPGTLQKTALLALNQRLTGRN